MRRPTAAIEENELSPMLSKDLRLELSNFPGMQFVLPGGRRAKEKFAPKR